KDKNNYFSTRSHYHHPRSFPLPHYVYHSKTVIVKNDAINIRKESLCMELDVTNPCRFFFSLSPLMPQLLDGNGSPDFIPSTQFLFFYLP
ncbi:hypothetical protein VIGAN_07060300, partial [Vigna angularis var. angularis]